MQPSPDHAHTLHCTDPNCPLPVAKIINGALVIEARHYGKRHQGVISLETLLQLLRQNSLTQTTPTVLDSASTALSPSS